MSVKGITKGILNIKRNGNVRWLLFLYDLFIFLAVDAVLLGTYCYFGVLSVRGILYHSAVSALCVFVFRFSLGVYNQIWRYGGIQCYMRLLLSDALAFILYIIINYLPVAESFSFSIVLAFISVNCLAALAIRMMYRYFYKTAQFGRLLKFMSGGKVEVHHRSDEHKIRVAIVGAGRVGVSLAEELLNNEGAAYTPRCFIETNELKIGRKIYNLPIFPETEETVENLKDYEVQEIIGVGGMSVVYKAYDNIDDRIVAVKILKDEFLANEEFRRRFKNESKAIAVLSHPNIVKVFDVSYGDKLQYIVMEYVEGITLKEYIEQQGVINQKEAVYFVMQLLRALQHAHDKGVVHRDIKPQNIMLLENGMIKVTDFGIARFSRSETRTLSDSTIGSVHYISPEQARGDVTDDKADLYSVGVMFYEMLTGKLPFTADSSVSVAIMQLQNDPEPPTKINPSIPAGLEQIIMHAMKKNVNDRYQSAAEMILDLEEFKRNPSVQFNYSYFVEQKKNDFARQEQLYKYQQKEI